MKRIMFLVFWILLLAESAFAETGYIAKNLSQFIDEYFGASGSYVSDINDNGDITGYYTSSSGSLSIRGFVSRDNTFLDIGQIGRTLEMAVMPEQINNNGWVMGMDFSNNWAVADTFIYDGNSIKLIENNDYALSNGEGLNDNNEIVGTEISYGPHLDHAFKYDSNGYEDLGGLGRTHAVLRDINNNGEAVGQTLGSGFNDPISIIYKNGETQQIPVENPVAINDNGQVVGYKNGNAVLYENGSLTDIGHLGNLDSMQPLDMNNGGAIVGGSNIGAFVYKDGTLNNLNDLIINKSDIGGPLVSPLSATAINNKGEIIVQRDRVSTLLTPVEMPEQKARSIVNPEIPVNLNLIPGIRNLSKNNTSSMFDLTSIQPEKPTFLIAHGFNDKVDDGGWVKEMAKEINDRLGDNANDINVLAYDWRGPASALVRWYESEDYGIPDKETYTGLGTVLKEAKDQSEFVALYFESNNFTDQIHLIGHSAGGTLVKETANILNQHGIVLKQVTLLDAPNYVNSSTSLVWTPHDLSSVEWADNYPSTWQLGADANPAYTVRLEPHSAVITTVNNPDIEIYLKESQIVNRLKQDTLDTITYIDKDGNQTTAEINTYRTTTLTEKHGYPIEYYKNTIKDATSEDGFYWSALNDGWNSDVRANLIGKKDTEVTIWPEIITTKIDTLQEEQFDSIDGWNRDGNVFLLDGNAHLMENSPAFLFTDLFIPNDAEAMSFDFRFLNTGDGDYFALNFNEDLLFWYDGRWFEGDDYLNSGLIDLRNYAGQNGVLTFSLNSFGEKNAHIEIDKFAMYDINYFKEGNTANAVPEPSTMFLFSLGGLFSFLHKRRKFIKK